jgi:CDP-diacylglycerol--serine O-phosphatidyltransferase
MSPYKDLTEKDLTASAWAANNVMSELKHGLRPEVDVEDSEIGDSGESARHRRRRLRRKRRRQLTLSVLPTLLTLGNGVCGLAAIAVAMSVNLGWTLESKMMVAGLLIFGGMLFDALDGSAARLTGQESEFGAELDSLCDAITFGTAPAVLVWRFNSGGFLPLKLTWAIGVLFALCVLIRLARFNVETEEDDSHEGFDGLPSPAAAGTIAAFAIAMHELSTYIPEKVAGTPSGDAAAMGSALATETTSDLTFGNVAWLAEQTLNGFHYFIPALALALAFLMVSRFQYPHILQQLIRGRRAPHQIGQALFVLIGAFLLHALVLPVAFCYYAFRAPVQAMWTRTKKTAESANPTSSG